MPPRTRQPRRRVMIVTGSRSEFGILRPVIDAVRKHPRLSLHLVVAGEHLLPPARTWREVAGAYPVAARVPMQRARDRGRADHAAATGRGLAGFAAVIERLRPDWVVVLGDRVEAFAAASAASIAGVAVCHVHGGDRAEGIADEAMRHAITKLAHLHCAATERSAERIVKMGEPARLVHVTGSPAIDGLDRVKPLDEQEWVKLGRPRAVLLLHPSGLAPEVDSQIALGVMAIMKLSDHSPAVILHPNSDPGREAILAAITSSRTKIVTGISASRRLRFAPLFTVLDHLPRETFLRLLARLAQRPPRGKEGVRGILFGNSSAGIIEAAALGLTTINIGPRQAGREQGDNVINCAVDPERIEDWLEGPMVDSFAKALRHVCRGRHPYGDGRAGVRIAALLAEVDPRDAALLRKRNTY